MTDRPILFKAEMVRAILAGTKTQTRRMVKFRKDAYFGCDMAPHELAGEVNHLHDYTNCPYGQPGDRLWVRETFVQGWDYDPETDRIQQFDAEGEQVPMKTWYRADGSDIGWCDEDGWQANVPWKPSIHMPRTASRITLRITSVRVERLQDISPDDCIAEGVWSAENRELGRGHEAIAAYRQLWEKINGDGSWAANPWVWVVAFAQEKAA